MVLGWLEWSAIKNDGFYVRRPDNTVLQHGPLHDLKKIKSVLAMLLLTKSAKIPAGDNYLWPRLEESEGENPFLRFQPFPLALTVVFARQSIEAKDFLLFVRVRGKVGEEKVKE